MLLQSFVLFRLSLVLTHNEGRVCVYIVYKYIMIYIYIYTYTHTLLGTVRGWEHRIQIACSCAPSQALRREAGRGGEGSHAQGGWWLLLSYCYTIAILLLLLVVVVVLLLLLLLLLLITILTCPRRVGGHVIRLACTVFGLNCGAGIYALSISLGEWQQSHVR